MNHTTICPAPDEYTFVGRLGDTMQGCRNCGRVEPAAGAAQTAPRRTSREELADAPDAYGIRHNLDCPATRVRREVTRTSPVDRCSDCRRFVFADPDTPAPDPFPEFKHGLGCARRGLFTTFIGRLGDELVVCTGCHVTLPEWKLTGTRKPATSAPVSVSRWRCPAHDEPVTPAGRGCGQCAAAADASRRRSEHRRRVGSENRAKSRGMVRAGR